MGAVVVVSCFAAAGDVVAVCVVDIEGSGVEIVELVATRLRDSAYCLDGVAIAPVKVFFPPSSV